MGRRLARSGTLAAAVTAALAVTACAGPGAAAPGAAAPGTAGSGAAGLRAAPVPPVPLATSLATSAGAWAVVPMARNPAFWQVFTRPGPAGSAWKLDTPPGAASNGGLVAAGGTAGGTDGGTDGGLSVAVRPSQDLTFTPLAATASGAARWTQPPPLPGGIADAPDSLAVRGKDLAAVTGHGTVTASTDGGTAWRALAAPARQVCGTVTVTAVSLTAGGGLLAGGACGLGGTAVLLAGSLNSPSPGWRTVRLPAAASGGRLLRLADGQALLESPDGLIALRQAHGTWTASAPLREAGPPLASGWLAPDGTGAKTGTKTGAGSWVLLPGGAAEVTGGPGQPWRTLPPVPARASVLASGPHGAVDALAVSGEDLTVWRLSPSAAGPGQTAGSRPAAGPGQAPRPAPGSGWRKVQTLRVPIQYGSSG